jgi:hypothetical protein
MRVKEELSEEEILKIITEKKDFSELPLEDVKRVYFLFSKRQESEEEKIRLTRELLHKLYGAFGSKKILSPKDKDEEWILRKHLSTRERMGNYSKIYSRLLKGFENEKLNIFDLGAGINGFSYKYLKEINPQIRYFGVEAVGQFVDLSNFYFEKEKLNARAFHFSLFELDKLEGIIKKEKGEGIIFMFKIIDALESVEKNYSKKLIKELSMLVNRIVVSFSTESMKSRRKFSSNRNWIIDFIKENFKVLDDFEINGERYLLFSKI